MLPTAQNSGGMQPLTGGTAPQSTRPLPVAVNCPSTALPPGAARIGTHTPVQRLGGRPAELNGASGTTLPTHPGCGNGISRPRHTMAWSGCGGGSSYGCGGKVQLTDDGGLVWINGDCAYWAGDPASENCTPGYWTSTCTAMGLGDNCDLGGSGYIPGGSGPTCLQTRSCPFQVAMRTPTSGAGCWGSPGVLGDNLPVSSVSSTTEITDILPMEANNAAGVPDIVGWMYETQAGNWMQESPNFADFWDTLAKQVPVLGPVVSAMSNGGMVQANSSQWSSVTNYMNSHHGSVGQCFSHPLAVS